MGQSEVWCCSSLIYRRASICAAILWRYLAVQNIRKATMTDGIEFVDVAIIGAGEDQNVLRRCLLRVDRLLTSTRMVWIGCGEDVPQASSCHKSLDC